MDKNKTFFKMASNVYQATRTETLANTTVPTPDYPQEVLQFTTNAIQNLKEGDRITIEYTPVGNKSNRIDLFKGVTKVETEKTEVTAVSLLTSWSGLAAVFLIGVPWIIGSSMIGSASVSLARSLYSKHY